MDRIRALRAQLHACPELSGHETRTLDTLEAFLRENTTLTVERRPEGLLATHWEGDGLPTLGFRADVDAIPVEGDPARARHGCGHDGHSAILCALAVRLEGKRVGKNLRLIFQPAEETGEGARRILDSWPEMAALHRIYGLHNIPGYPRGTVLARRSCFARASQGFIADVQGRPAHAAYPDQGANPAGVLCEAVLRLPRFIEDILQGDDRVLMATVIGLRLGGENFGLAAAEGRLCLTLRGDRQADIEALAHNARGTDVPERLALDRFSVVASDVITPMGTVRLRLDGELVEKVGTGDGPINACYAAIREIAGLPSARLEVYNLTAVDGGMDAQCEATVKVSNNGRSYRGSGVSTDIVEASIRAYIQALNAALADKDAAPAEFDHPQRGDTGVH